MQLQSYDDKRNTVMNLFLLRLWGNSAPYIKCLCDEFVLLFTVRLLKAWYILHTSLIQLWILWQIEPDVPGQRLLLGW